MDKLIVRGGSALRGRIEVSGAKNAALPMIAAVLLTDEEVVLEALPDVRDIRTLLKLLSVLGVDSTTDFAANTKQCRLCARDLKSVEAPYELVKTMRASVLVLGPLLARMGSARVSLPGGCAIGSRPINLHLKGFEKLGAEVQTSHGYVEASAKRLRGAEVYFDTVTVTGTENLMMAAALAEGETILRNAAQEPEVLNLADLLIAMGARITGAGTPVIRIEGVEKLHGATSRIIPDRIEAGTFMMAAAITGGDLEIHGCVPAHLSAFTQKLSEVGVPVDQLGPGTVRVRPANRLQSSDVITQPFPGFATDMQAQYMSLMTQAEGVSVITEAIFENRFLHAGELARMGADIRVDSRRALVRGKTRLTGAKVLASDQRASACLVLAGLVAEGETLIDRIYHLDRGYERLEEKLLGVGADIERIR
jgi:UDP-N-acetylglucosamine 1-carboxyvinyltransferase